MDAVPVVSYLFRNDLPLLGALGPVDKHTPENLTVGKKPGHPEVS
jgi:hypothetical protein